MLFSELNYQVIDSLVSISLWTIYCYIIQITFPIESFSTSTKRCKFNFKVSQDNYHKIIRNIVCWTHNILFFVFFGFYQLDSDILNILCLSSIGFYMFDTGYNILFDERNISNMIFIYHHIVAYMMFIIIPTNIEKYLTILLFNEISNIFLYPSYHYIKLYDFYNKNKNEIIKRILNQEEYRDILDYENKSKNIIGNLKFITAVWYSVFRIGWNFLFFMDTTIDHVLDYFIVILMMISFIWSYFIIKGTLKK